MIQITAIIIVTVAIGTLVRMIYISRKFRNPEKAIRAARRRLAAGRFM